MRIILLPMDLLDYTLLRKRFELQSPKQKIRIFLFSMIDENVKIHSQSVEDGFLAFLKSCRPCGSVGEFFYSETNLFVCIGKNTAQARTDVGKAMNSLYKNLKYFDQSEIEFEECEFVEDAIFSLILTSYSYDFLKRSKTTCSFLLSAPKHWKIIEIAHLQNIARFLGDTPANLMTPEIFVEYAKKIFQDDPVELKAYSKQFMVENEMNLILSVNQGSVQEPKLLQIKYMGKGDSSVTDIALVGKGVCFDTGGISIKPAEKMYRMKSDMVGAATLLCTFKLAVILGIKANMTVTIPLVENMPSGSATKPGDVFRSMAGITVEVDNTDAEGRLILADALTFAQKDQPKYLIDAATLTGAMTIALGSVYSGYFTVDDALSNQIYDAGIETNDLFWRMPLSPFYRESLKSFVADINNMGGRGGGSCKAAEFLKEFVDTNKTSWVHFDIAGMIDDSHLPEVYGKDVTGRPVRGFIRLIEKLTTHE